jgi:hypothetical protein
MAKMAQISEAPMVDVGDEVVIMSNPGRFRVVAIDGNQLTIENDRGVQKTVLAASVRTVPQSTAK